MEPQSKLGSAINVFSWNFNVQLPFVMHIKYCWSEICLLYEVDSLNIYSSMILFEALWPMMFCYQLGTIRGSSRSSTRLSFSNFISVTLWLVFIIKKPFMYLSIWIGFSIESISLNSTSRGHTPNYADVDVAGLHRGNPSPGEGDNSEVQSITRQGVRW